MDDEWNRLAVPAGFVHEYLVFFDFPFFELDASLPPRNA
jgi:hypothetical protein